MKFRFGIDTIDHLIAPQDRQFGVGNHPFVGCLVGPDGVGKSVLALHAASTYLHDLGENLPENQNCPIVLYASTDLDYQQAHTTWEAFGLDFPAARMAALNNLFPHSTDENQTPKPPPLIPESKLSKKIELRSISPYVSNTDTDTDNQEGTLEEIADTSKWNNNVFFSRSGRKIGWG